jgi:hypothetical protein
MAGERDGDAGEGGGAQDVVDRGGGDETAGGMMTSDGLPDDL